MSDPIPNSVFSRIFVSQKIEEDTKNLLIKWFPTYIKQIEYQLDLKSGSVKVPDPENYTSRNSFDALPGEQLPKIVVISPGIIGSPIKSGNGNIRATWRIGVGVATADQSETTAKLLGDIYGAAVRTIMLQQGGNELGGKIHWLDEQYVDLPISDQLKQFRAASIWFSIDIENVVNRRTGPATPNADPYAFGIVEEIDITIDKEGING